MVIVDGQNYYSCTEIARGINQDQKDFREMADLFRKVYKKKSDFFFTDTYIQSKLYTASVKNRIRYITFKKLNKEITYRSYSIPDVIDFLKTPDADHIAKCEKLNDVKIIEVGN